MGQYQDIMEKLSFQMLKLEAVERSQERWMRELSNSLKTEGPADSPEANPPPYTLMDDKSQADTIQIKTSCYRRTCRPWCSCRCHIRGSIRSPSIVSNFLGSLFVGYSGIPGVTEACSEKQCSKRSQVRLIASYQFPKWMWTRALFTTFATSREYGPELLVRVQHTIPYASETYQHCLNGEVVSLKRRFDDGLASPFDVDPDGISLLHVRHQCASESLSPLTYGIKK
jgi:hypothetical protein